MARNAVKKSGQAAAPLANCSIAVSGTFPGATHSALKDRIEALGGVFSRTVAADSTHLVSTQKDVEKNTAKVKSASANGIPIVGIHWLDDCETSNTKADETHYLLSAAAQSAPSSHPQPQMASNKRPASPAPASPTAAGPLAKKLKNASTAASAAQIGDGQNAKSAMLHVPLDEYCSQPSYQVYIASDGTIYDASLNQTNASNNNNKFYRLQIIRNSSGSDYKTWTRWGRVGERGQNAMLGYGSLDDALLQFSKKFKDKTGLKWDDRGGKQKPGKYAYIEKSYNPDSDDDDDAAEDSKSDISKAVSRRGSVQCTLNAPTRRLMELIFNQQYFDQTMNALQYDVQKLPLGKLSKATINRGFQALKDLAALFDDSSLAQSEHGMSVAAATELLSNAYYSVIPHAFGRNRPPVIRDNSLLKREIELLESLGDMKEAAAMMKSSLKDDGGIHPLDRQFQGLGMDQMEPLDPNSSEFAELSKYLMNTKGSTHRVSYEIQDIFRIQRKGEFERFQQSAYANVSSDRRLLWHGSRVTNFGGILSQGLRIAPPEAPPTGYMFGKGIYLADMSSKSANYCAASNSGGTALLLLCEAELGNPMQELIYASYTAGDDAKSKGMHSTWGKGMVGPTQWKDAKCVHESLSGTKMPDVSHIPGDTGVLGASLQYNEYICYGVEQVKIRYLFRVKM